MTKEIKKEVSVKKEMVDGKVKATVTTVTTENGKTSEATEVIEGTEAEVQSKLDALKK